MKDFITWLAGAVVVYVVVTALVNKNMPHHTKAEQNSAILSKLAEMGYI